jgi:hypothetical protein
MKKKGILIIGAILLITAGFAQAKAVSGTVDLTFMSNYIWRGFDLYNNNDCGIRTGLDLKFFDTGLGLNIFHARALGKNFENLQWMPLTLYYDSSLFGDAAYATNYHLAWTYYYFPETGPKGNVAAGAPGDGQEIQASFSWPKICPFGIVPSYTIVCLWPSASGSASSAWGGWAHIVGLGYDLKVPGFIPETPEQILHLSADLVYNGGFGALPGGGVVDHDWSHFVVGVSTDFDLPSNVTFTPALYWQLSMENSVNTQDEFWLTLSVAYKF